MTTRTASDWSTRFHAWQQFAQAIQARAYRLHVQMVERADAELGRGFGGAPIQGSWLLAHNWQDLPSLTHEQRKACRRVLWLHQQSNIPEEIARRITERAYRAIQS